MRAIDTNLLVRLIVRDAPSQVAAAEAFIAQGAWVSHLVLAEAVWVLDAVYRRTTGQIATAVRMLLDHRQLSLQDAETVEAALKHFHGAAAPDFSDCLVVEIARKAGHLPLGTIDRRLQGLHGVVQPR